MSICDGLDAIVDRHFHLDQPVAPATKLIGKAPHYAHKRAARHLSQHSLQNFNAAALLEEMLGRVQHNWQTSPRLQTLPPSQQNWRWQKLRTIAAANTSPEKILEKTIAGATVDDWVNQVPTASGLYQSNRDKHRCIDLVHRVTPGEYEFIELKVESNTPLYAAVEVLHYAVLYVLARSNYTPAQRAKHLLLQAHTIHLQVLAPAAYYESYDFDWLATALNIGLPSFADRYLPASESSGLKSVHMDFQFQAFPTGFSWSSNPTQCMTAVRNRASVVW